MMSLGAGLPYLLMMGLSAAFLWGAILAMRGRRWWATVMMVVGAGMQVGGDLLMVGGMVAMFSGVGRMGSSASSMATSLAPTMILVIGGLVLLGVGFILFAVGFIGFCARSGASERRAAELEGLVTQLQERVGG